MNGRDSGTDESDNSVVVYRTSVLLEADIVAEAMERAKIPYFRRLETVGGLSAAMPANPPAGLLPGGFWAIVVPGSWATRAARFISGLPVSQQVPASHAMPGAKDMFEGWTWILVLAIIVALLWTIIRMYTK